MSGYETGSNFAGYTIQGLVAGGGMGQVYAATHEVYAEAVALKVLHPKLHADKSWMKRFSVEGLVGTRLKHPNILSARELVSHNGRIALVMDLVRGGQTLEKVVAREHRDGLNLVQGLKVFLQIVQGIEYLHGKAIVHGDMKPENVLITGDYKDPDSWKVMVTDFGTVGLIADPVMIDGKPAVVATPRYAAPEHLYGIDKVVEISDIYAMGLVLHFIVTATHASTAKNVEEAARFVRRPLPEVALVHQPGSLIGLYKKACARNPEDRFQTARELALAVRDILSEVGEDLDLGKDLAADLATEIDEDMAERKRKAESDASGEPVPADGGSETSMKTEAVERPANVSAEATTAAGAYAAPEPEDMPFVDGEAVSPEDLAPKAEPAAKPKKTPPPTRAANEPEPEKTEARPRKAKVPADQVDADGPVPIWMWLIIVGSVGFLLMVAYMSWT